MAAKHHIAGVLAALLGPLTAPPLLLAAAKDASSAATVLDLDSSTTFGILIDAGSTGSRVRGGAANQDRCWTDAIDASPRYRRCASRPLIGSPDERVPTSAPSDPRPRPGRLWTETRTRRGGRRRDQDSSRRRRRFQRRREHARGATRRRSLAATRADAAAHAGAHLPVGQTRLRHPPAAAVAAAHVGALDGAHPAGS